MTDRLYYDNAYLTEFDAVVTSVTPCKAGSIVCLDRSAFYPTSGGQPYDTGTLNGFRVIDVEVNDNIVSHTVEGTFAVGDKVHGVIDWPRRFEHMQQHAADHMIAGAIWKLYKGVTIGLHLGADVSTIDIDMPNGETRLTPEQICAVEEIVNTNIQNDVPIRCWFPEAEELAALLSRKKPTVSAHVRIVAIGDYEMVPCGGTHPSSAGQIGLVKIVDTRGSKGKLRLSFLAGMRAFNDYQKKLNASTAAAESLSVKPEELPEAINRLKEEAAALKAELTAFKQQKINEAAKQALEQAEAVNGVRIVRLSLDEGNMQGLIGAVQLIIANEKAVALVCGKRDNGVNIVFGRSADIDDDMGKLMKAAASAHSGRGGGKSDFAQGSALDASVLDTAFEILKKR